MAEEWWPLAGCVKDNEPMPFGSAAHPHGPGGCLVLKMVWGAGLLPVGNSVSRNSYGIYEQLKVGVEITVGSHCCVGSGEALYGAVYGKA